MKGYIVTIDADKAFDYLSHPFLLVCLKKYGYGNDFIKWVEMLLECNSKVPYRIISELERIQKTFLRPFQLKIKNKTLVCRLFP